MDFNAPLISCIGHIPQFLQSAVTALDSSREFLRS